MSVPQILSAFQDKLSLHSSRITTHPVKGSTLRRLLSEARSPGCEQTGDTLHKQLKGSRPTSEYRMTHYSAAWKPVEMNSLSVQTMPTQSVLSSSPCLGRPVPRSKDVNQGKHSHHAGLARASLIIPVKWKSPRLSHFENVLK